MYVTPNGDIACKIICYGAPDSGRSTFITSLHQHLGGGHISDLTSIDLEGEAAKAFIWKSGQQVQVEGRSLIVTVITLSGRSRFHQARQTLVEASDGVLFIADTRRSQLDLNIDAMNDLMDHLRHHQLPEQLPTVIAYNRCDDPSTISVRQLDPLLNHFSAPSIETVASQGLGVDAVWLTLVSMLVPEAENALGDLGQGPEPQLGAPAASGWLLSCHACGSMLEVDNAEVGDVFTCGSCGASLRVIDPETGSTGPVVHPGISPSTSSNGGASLESQAYGLQSLPHPSSAVEPLSAIGTGTGPISAAKPFELTGFDLLKELDSSPLGQRFRLYEPARKRKVRAFRIDPSVVASSGYRVQIEPYVRMAAKVRHQNIVSIIGLRWQGNKPYLISEDAPNYESLTQVLARRRRLSPVQAMEIARHIATALEEAARQGVVHGFLRPDVVLLSPENHVLIDGLGIPKAHAHLIQALEGQSPSTEFYLAPEHLLVDAPSDIRSDLFLIGALIYRMVSAEGLVTGFNAVEALHRFNATGMGTVAGAGQSMPKELVSLLGKLTAVDRRDRFQHYGEAIEAFERVIGILERRGGGSGATSRAQTGTRRRTGDFARGGAGAIRGGTGAIRGGTAPIRAGTTTRRAGTPPVRTTGSLNRTRDLGQGSTPPERRRKRTPMISGVGLILIISLIAVLLVAVGYLIYQQQQVTQVTTAAQSTRANVDPDPQQTPPPLPPLQAARNAVAAYEADPNNDERLRNARNAIAQLTGAERVTLDQRLRTARDAHLASNASSETPAPAPSDAHPPQTTVAPEQATPPTMRPTATQLSAREQEQLAILRREQRFQQAISFVRERLAPGEMLDFHLNDIRDDYIRERTLARERVSAAATFAELSSLVEPALNRWQINDEDRSWAEGQIAAARERWADSAISTVATAPVENPATSAAATVEHSSPTLPQPPTSSFTLPKISPAGFTHLELSTDRRIVDIMRSENPDRQAVSEAIGQIPADSQNLLTLALREELWFKGPAIIQQAISDNQARLRVTNPVAGGQWDVVSADDRGLVIRNPTGSSMTINWRAMGHSEQAQLYQQLSRVANIGAESLAAAAVINLTLGQRTQAALLARQAKQADYPMATQMSALLELDRDRHLIEIIGQGIAAAKQLDPFVLEEVSTSLKAINTPPQLVKDAVAYFDKQRAAILAGTAVDNTAHDRLTFDKPDDRLAFSQRSGWMIDNGRYNNTGSGLLQRNDLGNAESFSTTFSLRNTEGRFRISFRGVEVIGQIANRRMAIRSAGVNQEQHQEFTFAANTMYTLAMKYNPMTRLMEVQINRLNPISVGLPRATSSLIVSAEDNHLISLDSITISRFGQSQPADQESILAQQEALRSLGLTPFGNTIKDPESPAIIIPEGISRSGLAIPLRENDKGIRFKASGNGQLLIRVSPQSQGTDGNYISLELPAIGEEPSTISVRINNGMWELKAEYPGSNPVILDHDLPAGANQVVVMGEKMVTIHSTPEPLP